jgi:hypothetical protein
MKSIIVSVLFTAVLSLVAAPSASKSGEVTKVDATAQTAPDDEQVQAASECVAAGGIGRKSHCRAGEVASDLDCGHDKGCCLPSV